MEIQSLLFSDLPFLYQLQPEGWADIASHFYFYVHSDNCFPIKVVANNTIIGIGTSIVYGDTAWLAHVIVHDGHRNKGIGFRITEALVNSLTGTVCETIYLIATDLGTPVYAKLGFETETEYVFFKDIYLDAAFLPLPEVCLLADNYKEDILRIDKRISGENREVLLRTHLSHAFVYKVQNTVQGYYLPDWGDGLIVATNVTAGTELMKKRLETNATACLPQDNEAGMKFLLNNNNTEFKRAKRMRLGKKRVWEPSNLYNRISGSLG